MNRVWRMACTLIHGTCMVISEIGVYEGKNRMSVNLVNEVFIDSKFEERGHTYILGL